MRLTSWARRLNDRALGRGSVMSAVTRYYDVTPQEWTSLDEARRRLGLSLRQVRRLIRHEHLDAALVDERTFGVTRASLTAEEQWRATAGRLRRAARRLGDLTDDLNL